MLNNILHCNIFHTNNIFGMIVFAYCKLNKSVVEILLNKTFNYVKFI